MLRSAGRFSAVLLVFAVAPTLRAADDDQSSLSDRAYAILKQHCFRCHGQDGTLEGGFSYVLDRDRLLNRKKVVPGDAKQSPLYKKIAAGKMPPPDAPSRPTAQEVEILQKWIEQGAVALGPKKPDRPPIGEAAVLAVIRDDLETLDRRARRFQRYFSLAPLANQRLSEDDLQLYRNALAKLLNSLSWHPRITLPKPIDRDKLILRIDLRDLMWDANLWNRLVNEYPYAVIHDTAAARAAIVGTATRVPVLRADWFIASASRPPLYYDLLQVPTSAAELERQLRIDVTLNILQERITRAGFNGSGISRNNRVLERHDSVHGAYWRTYDFDAIPQNLIERDILLPDRRNLFAYPLGPGGTENTFQHAGGEVIFNLPNGLHGFMLINAENTRIDKGPIAIVSDPRRPDRAVEPGVSCMGCHFTGILQKNDQIREHVAKNPKAFTAKDAELIRAHYAPAEKTKRLMDEDAERYRLALQKTGNKINKVEPVSTLTLRYEADVDLETAAAEAGLSPKDFLARVLPSETVARNLGALRTAGGTVSRQALIQGYADIARTLRLGSVPQNGATGQSLPDNTGEVDPLEGATNQTNAFAVSRDGRRALLASADKTVRLWDVEAGRELRRMVGHSASVWCVAFSPGGSQAASGGVDTVLRLWDVETGRDAGRLEGHGGLISAVVFSPDGKRLLSAALDHTVILWDLETGKEVRRFSDWKHVNALAFHPEGKQAVIAAGSVLHLVDLASGKEIRSFEGHSDSVTSAVFSKDGAKILTGSDDGTVRLWDVGMGRAVRSFLGHESYVKSVAFSPDGKKVLSGGSDAAVRLWELESGKELKRFGKHTATVLNATFTADGTATISGGSDADVRIWQLEKGKPAYNPELPSSTGQEPEAVRDLTPARRLSIPREVLDVRLSLNGRWLYWLVPGEKPVLERVDTHEMKRSKPLPLRTGTETFALSPDGKRIVALATVGGQAELQLIDAPRWEKGKWFAVAFPAYDMAVDDRGRIFLSGDTRDYAEIGVVSWDGVLQARWGGVWTRSFVRLSADQKRLYVSSQGVNPGALDAFVIPNRLEEKPVPLASPARMEHALGGAFLATSDERFLILRTGAILHSAADPASDLKHEKSLRSHLAAAVAPSRGLLFLATDDRLLHVYAYPDFKRKATYRLSGIPYHAVFDEARGKLLVTLLDPKRLPARPGERGDELVEFDFGGSLRPEASVEKK